MKKGKNISDDDSTTLFITDESKDETINFTPRECVICGRVYCPPVKPGLLYFSVHLSDKEKKRDIICLDCKKGIGFFKKRKDLMLKAINFLD